MVGKPTTCKQIAKKLYITARWRKFKCIKTCRIKAIFKIRYYYFRMRNFAVKFRITRLLGVGYIRYLIDYCRKYQKNKFKEIVFWILS